MKIFCKLSLALSFGVMTSPVLATSLHSPEIDLPSTQYHQMWQQYQTTELVQKQVQVEPYIEQAINGGSKLAKWIEVINSHRNADNKIFLTSQDTRRGIPLDKPNIYGPKQIQADLANLKQQLPLRIKNIVYGTTPINGTVPIDDQQFILYGRMIDRLYQTAVRWQVVIVPNKAWYTKRRQRDVRGYYYLNSLTDLDSKIEQFEKLDMAQQQKIHGSLRQICINNHLTEDFCEDQFILARQQLNGLIRYKNQYWPRAEKNWHKFFNISHPRTDIVSENNSMRMPFLQPENNRLQTWLQTNVEDEFQYKNWHFYIDFTEDALSHLEFETNTTPHVDDGNTIVMDQNTDIDEYEVKWTIRHEYGHILRLPDCYVEFYDPAIEAAVNYQLDTSDLMCSRAGNMNQRIYQELQAHYGKS